MLISVGTKHVGCCDGEDEVCLKVTVMTKEILLVWNLSDFDSNPYGITFGMLILLELIFDISKKILNHYSQFK